MIWRHLKDVLQEERIQFGDLPEDDQLHDGSETHCCRFGIQPADGRPTLRRKLQHGTLYFARSRRYILDAGPFVFAHFEYLADLETDPNAKAIADDHI